MLSKIHKPPVPVFSSRRRDRVEGAACSLLAAGSSAPALGAWTSYHDEAASAVTKFAATGSLGAVALAMIGGSLWALFRK